jgi:antitoxin component YwqK of YwqJK toxin-antitoxin module
MRQHTLTIIILTIALGQAFGQSDSPTVYNGLETKKFYSVGLSSQTTNVEGTYEVNGKKVSKSIYDKYESTWKNMETCCPCILKSYDENDVLIREAVSCTDCGVGVFKEFYPNGKVKLTGRYKENPTGNWKNIWDRGYCSVADGQWTYFNEKGDRLYSEFWKNGEFVKQVPEQKTNEIWKVELTLNGESVDKIALTSEQVRQLVITPKFKNSSKTENYFTIKFQVSAVGYRQNEKSFTIDSFKNIDVLQILSEVGIPSDKKTSFTLMLLDNGKAISNFYLDIKH